MIFLKNLDFMSRFILWQFGLSLFASWPFLILGNELEEDLEILEEASLQVYST